MKERSGIPVMRRPLVLVADDSDIMLTLLEKLMSRDYEVLSATNGEEAYAHALEKRPDVIITDLIMPGKDGYGLLKAIRSNPVLDHTPVVMLTAVNTDFNKLEGYRSGADAYLTKPFNNEELQLIVARIIENQKRLFSHAERTIRNTNETDSGQGMDELFIQKLDRVIEANLGNVDFTIAELSKEMAVSVSTLERRVKQLLATNPGLYLRDYRLTRALQLLKQRRGRVKEIANSCGFDNVSYFSVCFKQRFGVSPSEYLEMKFDI